MKRFSLGVAASALAVVLASGVSLQCATRGNDNPDAGVNLDGGGVDGGTPLDGGTPFDGGTPTDGGGTATDSTILQIQNDQVSPGTCVKVSAVVMSLVFDDPDDTFLSDGGTVKRKAFYISEKGLATTAARTGIEVVANTDVTAPTVSPGDDVTITAEYNEHFDNSTLRLTSACGTVTMNGTTTTPQPATLTIAQLGQSGGSPNCPPSGNPWVEGANAEDYEGVLVKITAGKVNSGNDSFGQFEVTDDGTNKLQVATTPFTLTVAPGANDTVNSITGFSHFSFCRRKLRPRSDADVTITPFVPTCGAGAKADHLLITEIKLGPTAGEFVEIHNPTGTTIDLSEYYLYNATYSGGTDSDGGTIPARYYYLITTGEHFSASSQGDFALKFPAGASISPGAYQVLAVTGAFNYCNTYFQGVTCEKPDYEIPPPASDDAAVPNMDGMFDNAGDNFTTFGFLTSVTSGGEDMVLFKWDGASATVQDVDYVIWGDRTLVRTDKTGVGTYVGDTPVASQKATAGNPSNSQSFQRFCYNEGDEPKTGGNGITGHNETGEPLDSTWKIADPTPKAATAGAP